MSQMSYTDLNILLWPAEPIPTMSNFMTAGDFQLCKSCLASTPVFLDNSTAPAHAQEVISSSTPCLSLSRCRCLQVVV